MDVLTLVFAGLAILAVGVFLGLWLRDELADEERDRLQVFVDAALDCKNYWRERAEKFEQAEQQQSVPVPDVDTFHDAVGPCRYRAFQPEMAMG